MLIEIENHTSVEAADMLGCSDSTVRVHLARAKQTLRERLNDWEFPMNRLEDALTRQRAIRPPEVLSIEVERAVMRRVLTSRMTAPRARQWSLTLAAVAAVGIVFITTSLPRRAPVAPPAAFVESVILLDDHVCIWLEPTAVSGSPRPCDLTTPGSSAAARRRAAACVVREKNRAAPADFRGRAFRDSGQR